VKINHRGIKFGNAEVGKNIGMVGRNPFEKLKN
jgi:hypothetical protein